MTEGVAGRGLTSELMMRALACDILVNQSGSSSHCFLPLPGKESDWASDRSTERVWACEARMWDVCFV